jgi:AraC-like DNA-binding protein
MSGQSVWVFRMSSKYLDTCNYRIVSFYSMNILLFSQFSFGRFVPLLLSLVVTVFLFNHYRKRRHSRHILFLSLYFFFVTLFNAAYFMAFSIYHEAGAYMWLITATAPIGIVFLVQFAYRFPVKSFHRESRVVYIISMIAALLSFLDFVIRSAGTSARITMTDYELAYNSQVIPVICFILFAWTIGIFLRQTITLSRKEGRTGPALNLFLHPASQQARAARNLSLIVILEIANSLFVILFMSFQAMSVGTINLIMNTLLLLSYTFFVIVLINNSGEPMLLTKKIAGIALVSVLFVIELTGQYALVVRDRAYDHRNLALLASQQKIVTAEKYRELAPQISYMVRITKSGESHTIYRKTGDCPFQPDLFQPYSVTGIFSSPRYLSGLLVDPRLKSRYYVRSCNKNFFHYYVSFNGTTYGIGFDFQEYRQYMHTVSLNLIITTIVFGLLALLLAPIAFFGGVISPLKRILLELDSSLDRSEGVEDEMVYLARAVGDTLRMNRELKARINELRENLVRDNQNRKDNKRLSPEAEKKITRVMDYIEKNYRYDISREGLAVYCNMSLSNLSSGFKMYTGMKIGDFVNQLRIRDAMVQLKGSDKSIIEIAFSTGFESLRTFNRVFFKINGITPSGYREKMTGSH